jgi:hypothetical protein
MATMTVQITGAGFPTSATKEGCLDGISTLLNSTYDVAIPGDYCGEVVDMQTSATPAMSATCDETWNLKLPARTRTEFGYSDFHCAVLNPCAIKNFVSPRLTVKFSPADQFQDTASPGPTSIVVTYEIPYLREIERLKTSKSKETIVYVVDGMITINAQEDTINAASCTSISGQALNVNEPSSPFKIDISSASVTVVSVVP